MPVRRVGGGGRSFVDEMMDDIRRAIEDEVSSLWEEELRVERDNSPKSRPQTVPAPEAPASEEGLNGATETDVTR